MASRAELIQAEVNNRARAISRQLHAQYTDMVVGYIRSVRAREQKLTEGAVRSGLTALTAGGLGALSGYIGGLEFQGIPLDLVGGVILRAGAALMPMDESLASTGDPELDQERQQQKMEQNESTRSYLAAIGDGAIASFVVPWSIGAGATLRSPARAPAATLLPPSPTPQGQATSQGLMLPAETLPAADRAMANALLLMGGT